MALRFTDTARYQHCCDKLQQMFAGLPLEEAQRWLAQLLGHPSWQALNTAGPSAPTDEALSGDAIAQRRRFQVETLLTLADIEEADALAVINALRPSAACAPLTVNEKIDQSLLENPSADLTLEGADQADFEQQLQGMMQALMEKKTR